MAAASATNTNSKVLLEQERIRIFIPDPELIWMEATVMNEHGDGTIDVHVLDTEYKMNPSLTNLSTKSLPQPFTTFPLQNVDVSENGVPDMTLLNYLHEPSILDNLHRRFKAELPYTYTGDICIAVNPYQWLDIYGKAVMERHTKHFRHEIQPHVYATSSSAYRGVRDYGKNQSILVSGESGAGKTETVKILMNHIAFISGRVNDSTIEKVLKANPLLESFGNAKMLEPKCSNKSKLR